MFSCAAGREGCCRQMSLACVGSTRSVPATLVLPCSWRMCFPHLYCSGSRLLYREQALSCMHFPGLSRSGSGSRVLHKSAGSIGPAFCPSPTRAAQAARSLTGSFSLGAARLIPSVVPASVSAHQSGAPCVCSGELASSYNPPSGCQPSRISGSVWLETGSLFPAG